MTARPARNRRLTAAVLVGVVAGMTGLAFASVPLYRLFCQVTGYGGTPRIAQDGNAPSATVDGRLITVSFDANVNAALPWRFKPEQRRLQVRLGEDTLAVYRAENLSNEPLVGTATFNITPNKAAQYFVKVDCFCFTEQRLAPGATADLPVSFYVDPAIADDPDARDVSTITLSYTFFRSEGEASRSSAVPGPTSVRTASRVPFAVPADDS
jgi:cytochrome c oxidase assembly protein subunit 11